MAKVILHIGTHKTATTTIQDTFAANARVLARLGLSYPILGRYSGHHGLVPNWPNRPKFYELADGPIESLAKIARKYAGSDQTVFISSEEFSRSGALEEIGRVRTALAPFETIEVICVLRSQWQFLQSVYAEIAKTRLPVRPPQITKAAIEDGRFEGLYVDYNRISDHLKAEFDRSEITFFDYDHLSGSKNGIVGAILRHAKISVPAGALRKINNGASNVSPMPLAVWLANIASEPAFAAPWLIERASEALRLEAAPDARSILFTRAEYQTLSSHFEPLNAQLRTRHAQRGSKLALSFPPAADFGLYRDDINSNFWAQLSRQLVKSMSSAA